MPRTTVEIPTRVQLKDSLIQLLLSGERPQDLGLKFTITKLSDKAHVTITVAYIGANGVEDLAIVAEDFPISEGNFLFLQDLRKCFEITIS
jgi:hypothetical protein